MVYFLKKGYSKVNPYEKEAISMIKVAILGAGGKVGSRVLTNALEKGMDVTAIVRKPTDFPENVKTIVKDVYELETSDIEEFDVLVNALGFWGDKITEFTPSTEHLIDILSGTKVRLIVVGGASSLYMDTAHTLQLRETPDFPKSYYPLGTEMAKALDIIRHSKGVTWTYISPAAEFSPNLPKKGHYIIAGEEFTTDENGESKLSYDDFATALVDEIQNNHYPNQRISVRW